MYACQIMKKTRSNRRRKTRQSRKFAFDPACWGKNKPLEQLWRDLSSYLSVIIIYKGTRPYEIVKLQSQRPIHDQLRTYDADPQVIAILSAQPNANNAYETLLYPKAKDKTVDHVITNYTRFFKRAPSQSIHKLMIIH